MLKKIQKLSHTEYSFVVTKHFLLKDMGVEKGDRRAKRIMQNPRNRKVVGQLIADLRKDAPLEHMLHSKFLVTYRTDNFGYSAIFTVKPHFPKK